MKSHIFKMMRYRDGEGISDLGNRPRGNGSAIQAMISRGEDRGLTGTWRREAMAMSIKFPAAPESTKACNWCSLPRSRE